MTAKIERGLGTERERQKKIESGLYIERVRLGTFSAFALPLGDTILNSRS